MVFVRLALDPVSLQVVPVPRQALEFCLVPVKRALFEPIRWQWLHLTPSRETSATISATNTPSSTPPGFLISYQAPPNSPLQRRDNSQFPTLNGQSTSACIHSPLFNVDSAGRLSVVNAGTSMTYSTSPGKASAPFAPSSNVGNISTAWSLVDGTLLWKNSAFLNGVASLCENSMGAIQAYFLELPLPDCSPISLSQTSG